MITIYVCGHDGYFGALRLVTQVHGQERLQIAAPSNEGPTGSIFTINATVFQVV